MTTNKKKTANKFARKRLDAHNSIAYPEDGDVVAPIDAGRCQTIIQHGVSVRSMFRMGPPDNGRCRNTPTWIGIYNGGGMSLCDDCQKLAARSIPGATFQKLINPRAPTVS